MAGATRWHISIIPFVSSSPEPVPPGGEPYLDPAGRAPATAERTERSGRHRRRAPVAFVLAVVAALAVSVVLGVGLDGSAGGLLPHGVSRPAGLVGTTVFAPAGAGVSVRLPATWVSTGAVSGFLFSARAARPPVDFVLVAAEDTTLDPVSPRVYGAGRRQALTRDGAAIASQTIGTVGGHPAIRLRYTFPSPGGPDTDTEYDISTSAGFGAGQTEYNWVSVVVGRPSSSGRQPLLRWIASTVRLVPAAPGTASPTYVRTGS